MLAKIITHVRKWWIYKKKEHIGAIKRHDVRPSVRPEVRTKRMFSRIAQSDLSNVTSGDSDLRFLDLEILLRTTGTRRNRIHQLWAFFIAIHSCVMSSDATDRRILMCWSH